MNNSDLTAPPAISSNAESTQRPPTNVQDLLNPTEAIETLRLILIRMSKGESRARQDSLKTLERLVEIREKSPELIEFLLTRAAGLPDLIHPEVQRLCPISMRDELRAKIKHAGDLLSTGEELNQLDCSKPISVHLLGTVDETKKQLELKLEAAQTTVDFLSDSRNVANSRAYREKFSSLRVHETNLSYAQSQLEVAVKRLSDSLSTYYKAQAEEHHSVHLLVELSQYLTERIPGLDQHIRVLCQGFARELDLLMARNNRGAIKNQDIEKAIKCSLIVAGGPVKEVLVVLHPDRFVERSQEFQNLIKFVASKLE